MAGKASKKDVVLDNMDNIKEWLGQGMTMDSIADALHISSTTLYKYLGGELEEIKKEARQVSVEKLENTMFTTATGYTKKVKKYQKVKRCIYDNGKKAEEWEEMVEYEEETYYPPDTTAGIFLLKNWGRYMNEPATVKLREEELNIKKKQIESNIW